MEPYVFISYSHKDYEIVTRVITELNARSIKTWYDAELQAGSRWELEIQKRLRNASALLIFISRASMESEYVRKEIATAVTKNTKILPILLDDTDMPYLLVSIQYFDLNHYVNLSVAIDRLANLIRPWITAPDSTAFTEKEIEQFSKEATREARGESDDAPTEGESPPDSVFIVHGRDTDLLQEVDEFVRSLGVKTVILTQISSQHQTLIQKFFAYGRAARFAIVLISSDDLGVFGESFRHPEGGDRTLKFRARQNVILELGFFYGLLSFENVFPLFRAPDVPFPDFERPSDLDGVLFFEVDDSGQWRDYLKERLKEAGFVIL